MSLSQRYYDEDNNMKDNQVNTRVALLEQSIGHINETLLRIEKRFDKIDDKLESLDKKIDTKYDILDKKIDSNFKWLIGTIISLFVLNLLSPTFTQLMSKLITKQ